MKQQADTNRDENERARRTIHGSPSRVDPYQAPFPGVNENRTPRPGTDMAYRPARAEALRTFAPRRGRRGWPLVTRSSSRTYATGPALRPPGIGTAGP